MEYKMLYIDSHLSFLEDIDQDGEKEIVSAKALEIQISKGNKIIHTFTPKYKKVKELEKIPKEQKEEKGETIGDMISDLIGIKKEEKNLLLVNRYNGIASLYELPNKHLWSCYLGGYIRDITYSQLTSEKYIDIIFVSDSDLIAIINEKGKVQKKIKATIFSKSTKVLVDDYNNDGENEIGLFDGLHIQWYNPKGELIERIDLKLRYNPKLVKTIDLDNDGKNELIIATTTGQVLTYKNTGELIDEFQLPASIISISALDINKDNYKEILASDSYGNLIIRGKNESIFTHENKDEIIEDIDGDGIIETLKRESKKVLIKKKEKNLWSTTKDSWITSMAIGDINSDNKPEIIIGSFNKKITVHDIDTGEVLAIIKTNKPPQTITLLDIDSDNKQEMIVTSDNETVIYKF